MLKQMRLTLMVALIALSVIAASFHALADGVKSGCAAGSPAACAGPCGGGGHAARMSGGRNGVLTRAYSNGVVKVRLGGCAGGCSLMVGVLKQANRPDPNASVTAELYTPEGKRSVALRQRAPGIFCAKAELAGATRLGLRISAGALSDYLQFDLSARTTPCGAMGSGGCGMKQGGCKMTEAGKCTGMGSGGCAMMGACQPAAAKTAACKCAVCKCSPCQCK